MSGIFTVGKRKQKIINRTRYTEREIRGWFTLGKKYMNSGISLCFQKENFCESPEIRVLILLETGAQIKGIPVYHPLMPVALSSYEDDALYFCLDLEATIEIGYKTK